MKKLVLALFLAQSVLAHAAPEYFEWDHPTKEFNARKKDRNSIRVEWRTVDDVRDYCSKMNIARGYGPILNSIKACSTQENNVCIIITGNETSMHTLGHELRHCFQGKWHSQ
jgi:hypothetical protein